MTPDGRAAPYPTFFGDFPDPVTMATALITAEVDMEGVRRAGPSDKGLRSTLARGALDRLDMAVGRFGQGIAQTNVTENVHTFVFATEASVVRRISGQTLGRRQIFHFRPYEQLVSLSPPGMPWAFGLITVPLGELAAGMPLEDNRMFVAPEDAMARLLGLMADFGRIVRDAPWILAEPAPAKALSGSVMEALAACLTQGRAKPDRAALMRHRQIVARFEDALRERPEEMLSLSAICAAVGVAERTLSLACQDFLGQSAMQYARARRLDLVRLRLLASDPARTHVTGVAMHYGFWELGRFARAYRMRFGELPSETLRRNGEAPGLH